MNISFRDWKNSLADLFNAENLSTVKDIVLKKPFSTKLVLSTSKSLIHQNLKLRCLVKIYLRNSSKLFPLFFPFPYASLVLVFFIQDSLLSSLHYMASSSIWILPLWLSEIKLEFHTWLIIFLIIVFSLSSPYNRHPLWGPVNRDVGE